MSFFSFLKQDEFVYKIPKKLMTDVTGFNFFSVLNEKTKREGLHILDFDQCEWFEANLCAVLGAIIESNSSQKRKFEIRNIEKQTFLINTFINNGFVKFIQDVPVRKSYKKHSGIPFAEYDMKDEEEFEKYIYEYILTHDDIPEMSKSAKNKIYRSIFELYQNSVMHSKAEKLFVCGQYYLIKGRMALTMVEFGDTFKHNVCKHFNDDSKSGKECIEWAVESGNTTKNTDQAGGLGLDLIRRFLVMNQGKLQIHSADGYWEEKKSNNFAENCENSFPGSIINIEFNLRDKNSYITTEEINMSDLF